ncbi:MAG: peptidoglycan-binding protein [Candidatus Omnitrophica bacterium]|nr:peptidoglycan-binding protein [Candidatus Omnitrophota bacterium]
MTRLQELAICLALVVLPGCVTTPVVNYGPENKQLKDQLSDRETQIQQLKTENEQLRRQVQALSQAKQEVRMPTASEIQTALKKAGFYKGPIDGQIGTQTKESIQKFQKANGMNPDGVVGSRTWTALSKYLSAK